MDQTSHASTRLVGSTLNVYRGSISATLKRENEDLEIQTGDLFHHETSQALQESNYFKSAQWYLRSTFLINLD